MISNLETRIQERKSPRNAPVDLMPIVERIDGLERRIDEKAQAHITVLTQLTVKHEEQYNELKKGIEITQEEQKHKAEADRLRAEILIIHEKLAKAEAEGPKEPVMFSASDSFSSPAKNTVNKVETKTQTATISGKSHGATFSKPPQEETKSSSAKAVQPPKESIQKSSAPPKKVAEKKTTHMQVTARSRENSLGASAGGDSHSLYRYSESTPGLTYGATTGSMHRLRRSISREQSLTYEMHREPVLIQEVYRSPTRVEVIEERHTPQEELMSYTVVRRMNHFKQLLAASNTRVSRGNSALRV